IDAIRLAFNQMRASADAAHADLGISAAMRAVLERLARGGPQTVPDMARARNVSRQHIQKIVDALGEAGLIDLTANPAHKRSPLIVLSADGRKLFAIIEKRETAILARISKDIEGHDLIAATDALKALTAAFQDWDRQHESA
ncbi:MAG TPA: MarR family transcriptional regulator, partial [Afifellaceae bacterium]|nr:MarR family transcriptional regulator [Afifellaceae bacterium]